MTVESAADKIVKLPLDRLLRHPFNEKLYGATSPKESKRPPAEPVALRV